MFKRKCTGCESLIEYNNKGNLSRANKANTICADCRQEISKIAKTRYCPRCDCAIEYSTMSAMKKGAKVNAVCLGCKKELCYMLKEVGRYRKCPKCKKNIKYFNTNTANLAREKGSPCLECINNMTYPEGMSKCSICKELKEIACFSKSRHKKSGIRSQCKECIAKWRKENPDAARMGKIRRREIKAKVESGFTAKEKQVTLLVFGNRCFNCETAEKITLDHHKPLSAGYALTLNNCVPLCGSCNSSKHNKPPEDFYNSKQINKANKFFKRAVKLGKKINSST